MTGVHGGVQEKLINLVKMKDTWVGMLEAVEHRAPPPTMRALHHPQPYRGRAGQCSGG